MKIAIFGSAFNPPTLGHADAIAWLTESERFDQIWLVPSFKHAFAKDMLDYRLRIALLRRFVEDLNNPQVFSHPVEHLMAQKERPVYTWDLLNYLQQQHGDAKHFSFVVGPDNKANWHKFYKAEEILKRWPLVEVPERKAIRSSLVREAIAQGADFQKMVSKSVFSMLHEQSLYLPKNL